MGAHAESANGLPTLTIPAEAAITPALFEALPPGEGSWRLVWHADHPPLLWQTTGATGQPVHELTVDDGVLDVATPAARHRSAWVLLRASGKPQDHWLSRHVHRRVSRLFSYVFLRVGLTANAATALTFLVGVASAWCMAQTSHATMAVGGLLFWFASIADGIDGEMARLTLSESAVGEQLDTAVDQLTYVAGIAGVLTGWSRQGIGPVGMLVAGTVVGGLPLLILWAMALVRRARRTEQFFVAMTPIDHAVRRVADQTRAPLVKMASLVFVLFRREAFSCAFFFVSLLTASRAAIPTLVAIGAAVAALTLVRYQAALTRALGEIVGPPAAAGARG